jgi:hypothetical protein
MGMQEVTGTSKDRWLFLTKLNIPLTCNAAITFLIVIQRS